MTTRSAVPFEGASRIHVGLGVRDLRRSVAFYRVLLGEEPVKVRPGYAKFEPTTPPVNLSLNEGPGGRAGGAQHFGIQVQDTDAVAAMTARFQAAGIPTRVEEHTTCCYAVQDKVWVEDPDGNPWEVFVVTEADAPAPKESGSTCCAPVTAPADETAAPAAGGSCCGG